MRTGYPLIPLVLAHLFIHRLIPASPAPPIASLSPSELGYDFVAYGLNSRLWTSVAAYLALVGLLVPHTWVGWEKAWPWTKRQIGLASGNDLPDAMQGPSSRAKSRRTMLGATVGLVAVVAAGLARLHAEGGGISSIMVRRYEAVFDRLPWERLFPRIFGRP